MTPPAAPDVPVGESGASVPAPPASSGPLAIFTRWWFWTLLIGVLWSLPLAKSLSATYPDPPPGFDREPESFSLVDVEGRTITPTELADFLVVVQSLDLGDPVAAERDFRRFRERKDRLRGLGSLVAQVILVESDDVYLLQRFLDDKTARRPNNLFLLDPDRTLAPALAGSAGRPDADYFVLDRHARLRGAFGPGPEEEDRFARLLVLLSNWVGSDPALGQPVHR